MEHESFEDEATARVMNEHFVNIKVDMEERPDVDQIYMTFVQMTTGRGGWPMKVFLTPDKLPFFGGTYFPPAPRYGMPCFQQILTSIAEAYRDRRDEICIRRMTFSASCGELTFPMHHRQDSRPTLLGRRIRELFADVRRDERRIRRGAEISAVDVAGVSASVLKRTGNERALEMVDKTLEKMADGGIYDQLGGGFHRYSVDAIWLVPHFEKMLYDNAQLIRVYLHLFQITKDEFYKRVAVETLEYVRREMLDARGGFYSTQDADSEGEEGKFFVWTPDEVESILGERDAQVFNFFYDVSDEGNFEGKNILNVLSRSRPLRTH